MQGKGSVMSAYLGTKAPQSATQAVKSKGTVSKTKVEEKKNQGGRSHQSHRTRSIGVDEPNMSDTGLLVTVEDLINTCFGQSDKNVVNIKMMQTILRFLAQQLRIMDHQVQMLDEKLPAGLAGSDVSSEGSDGGSKKKSSRKKRLTSKASREMKSDAKIPSERSEFAFKREKSNAKFMREKSAANVAKQAGRDESDKAKAHVTESKEEKRAKGGTGPLTTKIGSIEVVTLSQFKLLEKAVAALQAKAGPLPVPTLPGNTQLKEDISKGNASLSETMQVMQVSSRVHATETAIGRLIELMTDMAHARALPQDLARKVHEIAHDADIVQVEKEVKAGKSITQHDAMSKTSWRSETWTRPQSKTSRPDGGTTAAGERFSIDSDLLTIDDMKVIISQFRKEVFKTMNEITAHATAAADAAVTMAMSAQEKMQIAMSLDDRLSILDGLVSDYTQQWTGLEFGLATQITGFQEQLNQVRAEMGEAVVQMTKIRNNTETAAVIELTERYENLVNNLEDILYNHQHLESYHGQLSDEMQSMVQCVEMLRDQKADRDEVLDGLKDKADISRLSGMLMQDDFDFQRTGFELRVQMVYEKFRKQDYVWMAAVKDFTEVTALKANIDQVLLIREDLESKLQELHANVKVLQRILGQPQAAMATRSLRINASCGACSEPAVLDPVVPRAPLKLPALRAAPAADPTRDQICLTNFSATDEPPGGKKHICRRWVGGSHTLISHGATRERPQTVIPPLSRKTFIGLGTDNKYYNLDKQLLACEECNQFLEEDILEPPGEVSRFPEIGAGDQGDVPDAVIQDAASPDLVLSGSAAVADADDASRSGSLIINVVEDTSASIIINLID